MCTLGNRRLSPVLDVMQKFALDTRSRVFVAGFWKDQLAEKMQPLQRMEMVYYL